MNSFKIDNCVKCSDCKVNNRGKEWDENKFYIECELNVWEGQKGVRISEQFSRIPDNCPKIIVDDEN